MASDEARHFQFYRDAFKALLELDATRAVVSALQIMPRLAMPGSTIDGYAGMADVFRRAGIYGPSDYREIEREARRFRSTSSIGARSISTEHVGPPGA